MDTGQKTYYGTELLIKPSAASFPSRRDAFQGVKRLKRR
jgi:hypothetical protein